MAHRTLYLARHGDATSDGELSPTGRRQAEALGRRLATVPLAAIHHGPAPRAAQSAALIGRFLPDVPLRRCDLVGDYIPPVGDPGALPDAYAAILDGVPPGEHATGAALAAAVIDRYARPAATDTRELIVSHGFPIAWFVRHALDAPDGRWLGLNAANCALTVIRYGPDRPPTLLTFNDMSHLPADTQWTGFPPDLRV